ncbi:MAG TPA: septum formation initiator family protein [Candidatus Saccharimonadales bacterium]|nr:septum formation initiator family protein [Candidatus Saccharimonadales bacterium]
MRKYFTRANLGIVIGILASLYLLVILVGVIKRNHDLQTQINGLNTQITKLNDEKDQLSYQIQYYQTDAFKEKQARAKLGLASPGESVIILPRTDQSASDQTTQAATQKPKSHIAQWFDFLFGS